MVWSLKTCFRKFTLIRFLSFREHVIHTNHIELLNYFLILVIDKQKKVQKQKLSKYSSCALMKNMKVLPQNDEVRGL